jgi:Na+-translocating ferredoxin:NAD+ oxidoreductase RnfG subunit
MLRLNPITFLLIPTVVCVAPGWSAEFLTQAEAQRALFSEASAFEDHALKLTSEQRKKIKELSGLTQRSETQQVWRAVKDGKSLGWFIIDDVIGKHEYITYGCALSPEGKVIGIEILVYRETHGGQVRDAAWRKVFVSKTLKDKFELDNDVPNISGATLSSRNVMNGVKRLLALQQVMLSDG